MLHSFPVSLLVLMLSVVPLSQAQQAEKAQQHARQGIASAQAHNWVAAERELQAAVAAAPSTALYHAQLASVLGLEGKWRESLKNFEQAVALEPANLSYRRETAAVQWQLGLMDGAEKNLAYVLKAQPGDARATVLLGLVRESQQRYSEAAALLDSQYDLTVSQPDWTVALFDASIKDGSKEDTSRVMRVLEARAGDSAWTSAIARCAEIAASNGDMEKTLSLFALIPAISPGRQMAGLNLATLLYQSSRLPEARQVLEQLQKQDDGDVEDLLGKCLEGQHEWDLAAQAYQRSIALEPHKLPYFEDLAALYLRLGRTEDAGEVSNRAVALFPNDAKAWILKGDVELRMSAYQKAMESYTHASKLDPSSADVLLDLASLRFVAGETEEAVAQYKMGMARFPRDPRFFISCAEVLLGEPDAAKTQLYAKTLLQRAVALDPGSSEAHYQLGQLALQQQRWKDAESEFLLSARSAPDRSKTHFALAQLYRRIGKNDDADKQFRLYQSLKEQEGGAMRSPAGKP
jgi:tetratricopeptide (TPR) repeat protein